MLIQKDFNLLHHVSININFVFFFKLKKIFVFVFLFLLFFDSSNIIKIITNE